ncbi:hypothetical protein LJC46_09355 [Desulfovibrio sp. OttesenSCG-928-G15]|nr:hypothetical protein [Desulfovibrio sp. OttesenSCG-928-G15]
MNIFEVLKSIKYENDIDEMSFHTYPKQTLIQNDYDLTPSEREQLDKALALRDKFKFPFWDSLMLTFFENEKASSKFLQLSQRHNKNEIFFTSDIEYIESLTKTSSEPVSSCSKIKKNSEIYHLPFIDFHIPPSHENFKVVQSVVKTLDLSGFILDSGESYHFVCKNYYDEHFILDFFAKILFFSPIIDKSWVAHQILERSCSLRVSKKHDLIPYVIGEVQ